LLCESLLGEHNQVVEASVSFEARIWDRRDLMEQMVLFLGRVSLWQELPLELQMYLSFL
jgi:hypothetical protein